MRFHSLFVLLPLALATPACSLAKPLARPPLPTVTTTSAELPTRAAATPDVKPTVEPPGWRKLVSEEGGFFAELPKAAEKKSAGSGSGAIHFWQAKQRGLVFSLSYHDVAKSKQKPQDVLKDLGKGFFDGCKGGVTEDKGLVVEGHAARRFIGECGAGVPAIGEVHIAKGRAYELFVIFHDTSNEQDANRFFKSFRIEP